MHRQVSPFREVLSQQTVGIFIRPTLPWTLWITEVDFDIGVQTEAFVISHLLATIPGQRLVDLSWQFVRLLNERIDDPSWCPCSVP